MVAEQNIDWYIQKPERLLERKPFVRGASGDNYITDSEQVDPNTLVSVATMQGGEIKYNAISQSVYLMEYDNYSHSVNDMANMPVVTITFQNDRQWTSKHKVPVSSAYQKILHATQIQNLIHAGTDFTLCNPQSEVTPELAQSLIELEGLWKYECEESTKADIFSCAKSSGDVAVLFEGKEFNYNRRVLRYKDGYNQITNYDEYGRQVATSEYYRILQGEVERIDTYTNDKVYRFAKDNRKDPETGQPKDVDFRLIEGSGKAHGYKSNPLLQKRDKVAWEFVQPQITMYEILDNALAVCQKNYSNFMLIVYGDAEPDAFGTGQSGIKSIKVEDPESGNDVKVLTFPENSNIYKYMEHLKQQIEAFSFTTLGLNATTQTSGSDSRGGAMTMRYKADLALAMMTINDWDKFWKNYIQLFQEAMDKKYHNGAKYFQKLKLKVENKAWTPISESLLIDNIILCYEAGVLSRQTAVELCPLAKRNELERVLSEIEERLKQAQANKTEDTDTQSEENNKVTE